MAQQGPASRGDDQKNVIASGGAGKRVFVSAIAFTSAAGRTALPTTTDTTMDNGGRKIPSNACWVFQPIGADCHVALTANQPTVTNTNAAYVTAGLFDQQWSETTDAFISYKGDSASGTLLVFVLL